MQELFNRYCRIQLLTSFETCMQSEAYLWVHCLTNITFMMAITFASVVCCGRGMMDATSGQTSPVEWTVRSQHLIMAALHHAVSFGWEYMLWQMAGPLAQRRVPIDPNLREKLEKHKCLEHWGVHRRPPSENGYPLAPAIAAKVMAAGSSGGSLHPSIACRYCREGLEVGKYLLGTFMFLLHKVDDLYAQGVKDPRKVEGAQTSCNVRDGPPGNGTMQTRHSHVGTCFGTAGENV